MGDKQFLARQVQALCEITEAINVSLSQQEVFRAILERIVTVLGYKGATLRMLDQERKKLELKASFGLSDSYLTKGPVDVAKSLVDQTVLRGQTVTIADIRQDQSLQYPEAAAREGLASMIAVPLAVRERVMQQSAAVNVR